MAVGDELGDELALQGSLAGTLEQGVAMKGMSLAHRQNMPERVQSIERVNDGRDGFQFLGMT